MGEAPSSSSMRRPRRRFALPLAPLLGPATRQPRRVLSTPLHVPWQRHAQCDAPSCNAGLRTKPRRYEAPVAKRAARSTGGPCLKTASRACPRPRPRSASTSSSGQQQKDEPARVLFIMGVAATCVAWHTQIQALIARGRATGRPVQALAYDNRGVGRSSCPKDRRHYSSVAMARDAAALMAHLGWPCAHVVGFSMGTQIAGARPRPRRARGAS